MQGIQLPQYCQDQAESRMHRVNESDRVSFLTDRWFTCTIQRVRQARCTALRYFKVKYYDTLERQAVRSLGPLRFTCYQTSTRGLSTSSSRWDLNCSQQNSGKTLLGCGFALRCFQRLSLLDVAIQLWPRQANWLTSGPAISVLSYWR